ncbi:hypothetical protein ACFVUN_14765 [Kitasatospora griseola]|uniref:hypothetical protein n=1 Tax=Kitasatospora griseola TaxID=2064 RepID=UPI0036D954AF
MTSQIHDPIPYEQTSDYRWTEAAFELLESGALTARVMTNDNVSSAVVEGACPRCVHQFADRRALTVVTSGIGGSRSGAGMGGTHLGEPGGTDGYQVVLDITCSCGVAHPIDASGAAGSNAAGGCGVSFRIELAGPATAGGRP